MTVDEIRELIQLAAETGVAELEVQRGENRVRIRRSFPSETSVIMPQPAVLAVPTAMHAPPAAPAAAAAPAPPETPAAKSRDSLIYVKSPIVGTFYESASPDSEPFVKIGDHVKPGKVLCIIEAMKLMNEIPAEVAGVIETKEAINGKSVEYGEALFGIRPV
jgi:acetyl-CoA carboxylase biotin carboxyl carrier protein